MQQWRTFRTTTGVRYQTQGSARVAHRPFHECSIRVYQYQRLELVQELIIIIIIIIVFICKLLLFVLKTRTYCVHL
jgi:t-SNARE complex subunit (syntaxin)